MGEWVSNERRWEWERKLGWVSERLAFFFSVRGLLIEDEGHFVVRS